MNWEELIAAARWLATPTGVSQPTQSALKRAVSTAYYAMFHALCYSNAETLVGPRDSDNEQSWVRIYRAIDHGAAKDRIKEGRQRLPAPLRDFGDALPDLQEQRHLADYAPDMLFTEWATEMCINRAETATMQFMRSDPEERKRLAIRLLVRPR